MLGAFTRDFRLSGVSTVQPLVISFSNRTTLNKNFSSAIALHQRITTKKKTSVENFWEGSFHLNPMVSLALLVSTECLCGVSFYDAWQDPEASICVYGSIHTSVHRSKETSKNDGDVNDMRIKVESYVVLKSYQKRAHACVNVLRRWRHSASCSKWR